MPLTDTRVRTAGPKQAQYKLADIGGLYLLVRPNGTRYWRMDYRWAGKRGTLAFRVYPAVSLADARDKRDKAKKQIAAGIDPGVKRGLDKLASAVARKNTFRESRALRESRRSGWLRARKRAEPLPPSRRRNG